MLRSDFVPPVDPGFTDPEITGAFSGFFAFVVVVVLVGIGLSLYVGVRKYTLIKRAGHDPLTVDAAIAAKFLNSDLSHSGATVRDDAPARSIEERLAEVDALHERGVISDMERSAARAAILAG
jgi:hypothetical protein